jgi:hypothetical protein
MQNITTVAELKNAIQILEVEHSVQEQQLKKQLSLTYESLRPINLIRNILKEFFPSHSLTENFSDNAIGMISGLLIKKIFVGKSGNSLRKFLGSIAQFGISNMVAQNAGFIKSVSHAFFQYLFPKKK